MVSPLHTMAGTFKAFKIEEYNRSQLISETWYSPEVKWFVKQKISARGEGHLEWSLISYSIK